MNPTPDHLEDEILSALLDGDDGLAAAAHLRACDQCAGRQAELAAARAALAAAPVEPLDDLARRRVLAAALTAGAEGESPGQTPSAATPIGRSRWARRHPALVGSAAAVLLAVLVGVPFVLGDNASHDQTALSARAPEGAQESAGSFLGDLGDLADRESLRLRLSGGRQTDTFASVPAEPGPSPAAGAPTAAPLAGVTPSGGGLVTTTVPNGAAAAPPAGRSAGGGAAEKSSQTADDAAGSNSLAYEEAGRDRADTDACVAALLNGPARGGRVTAFGTGGFEGRPAVVVVFDLSGGRVAFIADRSGCKVLDRFSL